MSVNAADFPILVTDAQTVAGLACLRSLAQAGYPVWVIGENDDMLCFDSVFATRKEICPAYASADFSDWVFDFVKKHGIRLVLPTERFLISLGDRLDEIRPFLHTRVPLETLKISFSKTRLFQAFEDAPDPKLRDFLPPYRIVDLSRPATLETLKISGWKGPFFIKCDALESKDGSPSQVVKVSKRERLLVELAKLSTSYTRVLLQDYVTGRGAGAFLLRWQGRLMARFAHQRLHEIPYTGGHSSLRCAHVDEELFADAERRAALLGWEGPAMFEYRQDPKSGRFALMELNARFWGSLHLALYAGVDFPKILADLVRGAAVEPQLAYDEKCLARLTVPGEIQHTWSFLKDRQRPLHAKLGKLCEFFWLFVKPGVRDDLFYPGDRRVFFSTLRKYVLSFFRK
jgi:hypothetical protein